VKKRPILWIVIAVNLVVLVALAFIYPQLMVSPGPLVKGHAALSTDCFACHAVWRGASSGLCISCHAVADIGLKTTRGVPIVASAHKAPFHQSLTEQDCMACHSDHQGPQLTQRNRKPFSHTLLKATVRDRCSSCHAAPTDTVHRDLKVECSQCHQSQAWKPAHFDHALLAKTALDRCESCHKPPTDRLHRQIQGSCGSCHQTTAWKPASFEHDQHFVLDRDHQASCETCHLNNDYSRYTCYGCHEHTPAKIRAKHIEEGIQNFENCVECHRDPGTEPEKGGGGSRGRRERD
jgi:hypothetical protein